MSESAKHPDGPDNTSAEVVALQESSGAEAIAAKIQGVWVYSIHLDYTKYGPYNACFDQDSYQQIYADEASRKAQAQDIAVDRLGAGGRRGRLQCALPPGLDRGDQGHALRLGGGMARDQGFRGQGVQGLLP
ncbi:hypothetical protein ACFWJW_19145 [Streptomyces sp. NPDC127097]|uniref:hypothetical protein n=1 Tax=Streptomyces sp. NPDC127097 TaxID=3347136 RepID=UPI003669B948